jgi:hypothetical protein
MATLTQDIQDARRVATAKSWRGARGGWIYDSKGRPICQGWHALASRLRLLRVIGQVPVNGVHQIDWRVLDTHPAWRNR